ncbi:hypothetical protein HNR60_003778 [Rhodopseudomonas rhenobacensis]|uniref:DUF3108 domain-containing protein n=1 Tax=Rhodopseudomonas rhenobacensis TaxID=87461 RepID=A0A7W7Z6P6_9BRAD|nr:hypothetical protein [Rhodopseudomonas rhenobacensis]
MTGSAVSLPVALATAVASAARGAGRCGLLLLGVLAIAPSDPAHAQGSLDARYEATLAGIPVGKGVWRIDIGDDQYTASASGGSSGLLKAFAGGDGTGASQGRVVNSQLQPTNYSASTTTSRKSESIRMTLAGGAIKEFSILPEPPVDADRIPVTEAHRRGVFDPMTGSLVRAAGAGDPLAADSCRTTTAIFDGRMRYDLRLEFKRLDTVKAEKGYRGPALVCAIYFSPISGYIADRAAIKYLVAQRDMEVWLVPIAGTRILVPFRLKIPTPLGNAVLEATQFVTAATAPRAASKTQ